MVISQGLHMPIEKESVAAASVLFFSAHSTAFNLKETLYDFL